MLQSLLLEISKQVELVNKAVKEDQFRKRHEIGYILNFLIVDSYPGSGGSALCFSDSVFAASSIQPPES